MPLELSEKKYVGVRKIYNDWSFWPQQSVRESSQLNIVKSSWALAKDGSSQVKKPVLYQSPLKEEQRSNLSGYVSSGGVDHISSWLSLSLSLSLIEQFHYNFHK